MIKIPLDESKFMVHEFKFNKQLEAIVKQAIKEYKPENCLDYFAIESILTTTITSEIILASMIKGIKLRKKLRQNNR